MLSYEQEKRITAAMSAIELCIENGMTITVLRHEDVVRLCGTRKDVKELTPLIKEHKAEILDLFGTYWYVKNAIERAEIAKGD